MKRALITGATGFIGANLARRLIDDGCEVHLLLRKGFRPWRIKDIRHQAKTYICDISQAKPTFQLLKKVKPDWVFHLAAFGAYSTQTDQKRMIGTNMIGTANLVEASIAQGVSSFINVGSSSEYGFKDHAPKETEKLEPNSYYALSKACASLFCRQQAINLKKKIITLRPYSVYGPFEGPARLIPRLIIKGLEGKLPPLVDPNVARDYIYVDDFLDACLLAAKKKQAGFGMIYNVGTGKQTTIRQSVETLKEILPIKERPRFGSMQSRSWDTNTWVSDTGLIRQTLGWKPQYSFKEGLQKTIEWFLKNPTILKKYQKEIL